MVQPLVLSGQEARHQQTQHLRPVRRTPAGRYTDTSRCKARTRKQDHDRLVQLLDDRSARLARAGNTLGALVRGSEPTARQLVVRSATSPHKQVPLSRGRVLRLERLRSTRSGCG